MKRIVRGLIRTAAKEVLKRQAKKVIVKVLTPKPAAKATPKVAPRPVQKVAAKVAQKVASKVTPKAGPTSTPRKEPTMNPVILGALRHIIQVGAGALGMDAFASGDGLTLAVTAAVSVANLVWFGVQTYLANRAKA